MSDDATHAFMETTGVNDPATAARALAAANGDLDAAVARHFDEEAAAGADDGTEAAEEAAAPLAASSNGLARSPGDEDSTADCSGSPVALPIAALARGRALEMGAKTADLRASAHSCARPSFPSGVRPRLRIHARFTSSIARRSGDAKS
mmetsp:Transcript_30565/g.97764  ORF Transcript_30565/g.97764 Transcript_30565/m.97764 type:complete len:149 (-) Transcript_30565:339-785(-)